MKCPVCLIEHTKSTVTEGGGARTLMGHLPFHDEEGKRHDHDPNISTTGYRDAVAAPLFCLFRAGVINADRHVHLEVVAAVAAPTRPLQSNREDVPSAALVTDWSILSAMRA